MSNQLVKGSGIGTREWQQDFALTAADQITPFFKVAQSNGQVSMSLGGLGAANLRGVLSRNVTQASTTANATKQTLMSYSLPAGILAAGQGVRILAWGTTGANGNNKTVEIDFGSQSVISTGVQAANAQEWFLDASVFFITATTQTAFAQGFSNAAALAAVGAFAGTQNTANAVTIALAGTNGSASAGDVVCNGLIVELLS